MPNTKVVGIIFPYILTPIPNLYDHSFPRYGQITFLTFRRPTTLTFDLKFWKYLSVTVYPYVICMPSFIMIGWEMAEILHFEILRKHGQTHKQTHTHKQTDMGITIPRPPPMGGEVKRMYEMVHTPIDVSGQRRCNRLRCPLARLSGLQCFNMGHNGHGINLYGIVIILMRNLHVGGQSRPI